MKSLRWMAVATAVAWATGASATNGMRMIGFSPVQNAMGGATVGLPLDAATQITNPAGLPDVGGRADFGALYFNPTVTGTMQTQAGALAADSQRGASPIPSVGLVRQLDGGLAFGVGMWGVGGMGVDYQGGLAYSSYSQMRFTPSVAYRLNDVFSVGVTLNGMYAQMEFSGVQQASALGLGAVVGVLVTPMKELTIGLAYETKSAFKKFEFQAVDAGTGALVKDELQFDQPAAATLGLGWRPLELLAIAADVQWINWSDTNGKNKPEWTANVTGQGPWNLDWKDQVVFKLGVQVEPVKGLNLRLGYNYGKAPINKDRQVENFFFPALTEQHLTAGVGFALSPKLSVNLSGMYAPEAKVTAAGLPPDAGTGFPGFPPTEVKMSQWEVGAAVSFHL